MDTMSAWIEVFCAENDDYLNDKIIWLAGNCEYKYYIDWNTIAFEAESDVILYKLRWG